MNLLNNVANTTSITMIPYHNTITPRYVEYDNVVKLAKFLIGKMPNSMPNNQWKKHKIEAQLEGIEWINPTSVRRALLHTNSCPKRTVLEKEEAFNLYTQLSFYEYTGAKNKFCRLCLSLRNSSLFTSREPVRNDTSTPTQQNGITLKKGLLPLSIEEKSEIKKPFQCFHVSCNKSYTLLRYLHRHINSAHSELKTSTFLITGTASTSTDNFIFPNYD